MLIVTVSNISHFRFKEKKDVQYLETKKWTEGFPELGYSQFI